MKRMREIPKVDGRKFSSGYNVYVRAAGKSVAGPGVFGVVILGEGSGDIFRKGYPVNSYTFPSREYLAARKVLELLDGRQNRKIVLHFGEQGIVNQLNGIWGVNWSLERCAGEFREVIGSFSDVAYENVGSGNEWIIEAKRLANCELYDSYGIR